MPKTFEHVFADLHGTPEEPASTVVDLGEDTTVQTDATGARVQLNPPPKNPDAGKADQFGDISPAPKGDEVDDGVDVDLDGGVTEPAERAGGGADDDDDLKGLSENVRKRILRERRMRTEAEERQRRTEAELAAVSRKVDLQAKETEWTSADEKADEQLRELRAKKVKALEEGKTEEVVDLDDKITDLKADKRTRDAERTRLREEAKKAPVVAAAPNPKAQAWIEAHPKFSADPLFAKAARAADQALNAMGYNSQSDEYYVELTKILAKKYADDVDPRYLKGSKQSRPGPRGMGSDGTRNASGVQRSSQGRMTVTVTTADKAMLAAMGQDVDDPNVIKAYAREKLAMARQDAAARGER